MHTSRLESVCRTAGGPLRRLTNKLFFPQRSLRTNESCPSIQKQQASIDLVGLPISLAILDLNRSLDGTQSAHITLSQRTAGIETNSMVVDNTIDLTM